MVKALSKDWIDWIELNNRLGNDRRQMMERLLENRFSDKEVIELVYGEDQRAIPKKWMDWLVENRNRGVSEGELYKKLLCEGFRYEDVCRELGYRLETSVDEDPRYYKAMSEVVLANSRRVATDKVIMYIVDDFMDEEMCRGLCRRIKERNTKSTITNEFEKDKEYRTSKTSHFDMTDTLAKRADQQICDYMDIPTERSETIQGQYYQVGNQFKHHTDWFDPSIKEEWERYGREMGQRTWTFMIYLNDVEEGGETYFQNLDIHMRPKRGRAVVWYNLYPNGVGNPDTRHCGKPVVRGEKYIITKWFRSKGKGNPYL